MFSVFNIADHVIMIDNGKVRFEGSVPELRESKDAEVVEFLARYIAEGF
jgi:ABC-type transporter Mla maintaining outer membrane lipid asymmetry ATPase subunit MlaF